VVSIVAIVGFIALEVQPLFRSPTAVTTSTFALDRSSRRFAVATEEYREVMEAVTEGGEVEFLDLRDGSVLQTIPVPGLEGRRISAAARAGKDHVLIATDTGELVGVRIPFDVRREEGRRVLQPRVTETGVWTLSETGTAPALFAAGAPGDGNLTAVFAGHDGGPQLLAVRESKNLFGVAQRRELRTELPLHHGGTATAAVVGEDGRRVYVATSNGYVYYWDLVDADSPLLVDAADVTEERNLPVTVLAFLLGDQSLIVGDGVGRVSVWFPVRDAGRDSGWRLQQVHVFTPHRGAVNAVAASPRDKGFLTADDTGQVLLRHATTAQTLLELPGLPGPVQALAFSPKADGGLAIGADGTIVNWDISNPHPETTWQALFGKIWYEGYEAPAYVWQSTGGTDDFEPKLSLVPLLFGTMKGTLYALLFAVPIAVLGALYTSQFSHPALRNLIKPTVEIMAALPSVVLGFLAGLWLAPAIEGVVPGVLAMILFVPALLLVFGALWHRVPLGVRSWVRPGMEVVVVVPLVMAGVQLCLWASPFLEQIFFGGDFRLWLGTQLGMRFDQRNALVVGFAMGFAVIPIIFTISEDALSNVPQRLSSASLALGATPWQTALRVVLPTASAGIFSAIMIGFGRAVGETMIVLMATGNTPVLDWSIFTGMRTLSANIAVEIPEAPHGGSLYRVLFLAALLLFVVTFIVNTVAEIVRLRLRQRYQRL
jgi:phosphate transport system permease protein